MEPVTNVFANDVVSLPQGQSLLVVARCRPQSADCQQQTNCAGAIFQVLFDVVGLVGGVIRQLNLGSVTNRQQQSSTGPFRMISNI